MDKDFTIKDKDQNKDCNFVLKDSLRTRTRTNNTGKNGAKIFATVFFDGKVGSCERFLTSDVERFLCDRWSPAAQRANEGFTPWRCPSVFLFVCLSFRLLPEART